MFHCLNLIKTNTDHFVTYIGIINHECVSLIFVCDPSLLTFADSHMRILAQIEQNPDITQQQVPVECQRFIIIKHNSFLIQRLAMRKTVNTIEKSQQTSVSKSKTLSR